MSDKKESFDVIATVIGGGLSGQAGAVRHGIAKALINFDPSLRNALKKAGLITRDARRVSVRNTVFIKHVVARNSLNVNRKDCFIWIFLSSFKTFSVTNSKNE